MINERSLLPSPHSAEAAREGLIHESVLSLACSPAFRTLPQQQYFASVFHLPPLPHSRPNPCVTRSPHPMMHLRDVHTACCRSRGPILSICTNAAKPPFACSLKLRDRGKPAISFGVCTGSVIHRHTSSASPTLVQAALCARRKRSSRHAAPSQHDRFSTFFARGPAYICV